MLQHREHHACTTEHIRSPKSTAQDCSFPSVCRCGWIITPYHPETWLPTRPVRNPARCLFPVLLVFVVSPLETVREVAWRFLTSYSTPVVTCYLLMVFLAKPVLMKLFSPFQLRTPLVVHNFVCCASSLVSMLMLSYGIGLDGNIFTNMPNVGNNPYVSYGLFIYWITKYYELLDTVFMLLRHKIRQMSFLHVFHHASMAFLSDYSFHYAPYVSIAFGLSINSFVHVVMYGYYALTAIYPLQEFAWKRRITQLQMIQFVIGVTHSIYGYLYYRICIYSILYTLSLLTLFSNFYYHAFVLKKTPKKQN